MNRSSIVVALSLAAVLVNPSVKSRAQGPSRTAQAGARQKFPWSDVTMSPDQRADLVIKQLTLEEKIQLVHGIGWGPLRPGAPTPPDNNGGGGESGRGHG